MTFNLCFISDVINFHEDLKVLKNVITENLLKPK